jgi:polyisoprenyl-phosphate glycosyltransferase
MAKNKLKKPAPLTKLQDIFVSAVLVVKEDSKGVAEYVGKLSEALSSRYTNYEIIIVDNGVKEDEVGKLTESLLTYPCIRVIRLTQSFRYDTALFAGLEVSIGDFVCTLDPSIDPVDKIPHLVEKNQKKDVVQGVSSIPMTASRTSRMGRRLFYWYNRKYIGIDIPVNATYFASYSRKAVNALTQTTRSQHHIRHLARRVGYAYEAVPYEPVRHPSSSKKLKRGFIEAIEIAISYSTHPLRFVTWLGLVAGVANVLYAAYVVFVNIFDRNVVEGWTTTSLQLSVMFFVLFMIVIIISEYIGRILTESYKDPQYYITDELTSTVALADTERRNVTK